MHLGVDHKVFCTGHRGETQGSEVEARKMRRGTKGKNGKGTKMKKETKKKGK